MTVEEVQKALREYPPDAEVVLALQRGGVCLCDIDEIVGGALPRTVLIILGEFRRGLEVASHTCTPEGAALEHEE